MSVAVKICGLNRPESVDAAVAAEADYVGFNFFPPSPRVVTPAQAAGLAARMPAEIRRVGLFVDPEEDAIAAALAEIPLDILQLYAPPDRVAALRARFGLPVWRAVSIGTAADLPPASDGADAFLLDAKPGPDATRPGGNALRFDWSLIAGWAAPSPWILAGGLTPENVAAAVRMTGATVVDVSSGVERAPGCKDPALIRAFVAAARG
jgi:phosphoribosylanthranilate isomerase